VKVTVSQCKYCHSVGTAKVTKISLYFVAVRVAPQEVGYIRAA